MKIGLLSDSHDHHRHVEKAIALFQQHEVVHVLHAGDYVNPGSVRLFQGMRLTGVLGNNDGDLLHLGKTFESIHGNLLGNFGELTLHGRHIGIYHGTERGLKEALIASGTYDLLIFGHTHVAEERWVGKTLVLNPGTVHGFYKMASVMVVDLESNQVELLQIQDHHL